jgi:hypothetical protein
MTEIDGHDKIKLAMVAIGAATILMSIALTMGHDGALLATTFAFIGAITGGVLGFSYGVIKNEQEKGF